MSRPFTCAECGGEYTTDKARGPVPKHCDVCKAVLDPKRLRDPERPIRKNTQRSMNPSNLIAEQKVRMALEMRRDYHTWGQIAAACGYGTPGAAHKACQTEINRRQAEMDETIDDMRRRELDRLENLSAAALDIMEKNHYVVNSGAVVAHQGQVLIDSGPTLAAIRTLIQVSDARRKLLGLDAATKSDVGVQVQFTVQGIPEGEMP